MTEQYFGDNRVKQLTPGIQTVKEKAEKVKPNSPESQLKNEELFYRTLAK